MLRSEPTSQAEAHRKTETFLSYNRNDSVVVAEVALELRERGVNVWMDESNLVPGERWQHEIARAFERADSIAVCIGGHGIGGWQKLELEQMIARQPEHGTRIVPIVLPDAPRSLLLPPHLSRFMACDLRKLDRATQLDNLSAVLLADSEWPVTATRQRLGTVQRAPSWLQAFYESDGKTLDPTSLGPEVPWHVAVYDLGEPIDQ